MFVIIGVESANVYSRHAEKQSGMDIAMVLRFVGILWHLRLVESSSKPMELL